MRTLVIDIGTSSMRGVLFAPDGGKLAVSQIKYRPHYGEDGAVEQDAGELREALFRIAAGAAEAAGQAGESIGMVACTAQRSSILPVDRDGAPLAPFIMWQDTRNREVCSRLEAYNEEIFARSGAYVNAVFSGSKMTWVRQNRPDLYQRAYKFLNIPEYLIHCMTGAFLTDHTYGSRSNLMDIRRRQWDPELLRLFGVEEEKLCGLREAGSVLGTVTRSFSRATGLTEGLPVLSCGGDQQCAAVGQGAFQKGVASIVAGTGAYLIATVDSVPDGLEGRLICNAAAVPGKYTLEANTLTCCSAFDWFCDSFYPGCEGFDSVAKELLDQYHRETHCVALPYFQGRSTPDWNPAATASFHNITLSTTRREMLAALLDAIFLEIKGNMDNMGRYVEIGKGYISGGLTRTPIINQMQADVYGIPLCRMEDCEATAIGALMVALTSQGVYGSMEEAFRAIRGGERTEVFTPDPEKFRRHCRTQRKMELLYAALKQTVQMDKGECI